MDASGSVVANLLLTALVEEGGLVGWKQIAAKGRERVQRGTTTRLFERQNISFFDP